jgi:hypothetical protein
MTTYYPRKITKEQQRSLLSLYQRQLLNDEGATYRSYKHMRKATVVSFDGTGCIMIQLWRMWLGIEKDGYTHS